MAHFAGVSSTVLGDATISFLADGGGRTKPTASFPASDDEGWGRHRDALSDSGELVTSIGGFLIELPERKIVVDTGIGPVTIDFPGFGPFSGGAFLESLASTGVDPADVTDVVFTHLHLDHVGWTTTERDGNRALTFPNARHLVSRVEWDAWYGRDDPLGPHPELVQKPLDGRIQWLEDGDAVADGVHVLSTPGHSPGHMSVDVWQGGQRLIILGDLIHSPVQLAEPTWRIAFDADPDLAAASRERVLRDLEHPDTTAAVGHFADNVFGQVVWEDGARRWRPH